MSPPCPLPELQELDRNSPQFHEQLNTLLDDNERRRVISSLEGEDLAWFVEYLDNVSLQTIFPHPALIVE
jgi:hypothetical protein